LLRALLLKHRLWLLWLLLALLNGYLLTRIVHAHLHLLLTRHRRRLHRSRHLLREWGLPNPYHPSWRPLLQHASLHRRGVSSSCVSNMDEFVIKLSIVIGLEDKGLFRGMTKESGTGTRHTLVAASLNALTSNDIAACAAFRSSI
jgi:hypothetical protein